jgi:hypothetical protein
MPEHAIQPLYTSERVVVQLFRLFRLARMHDLGNEAVARALDEAQALLREGCGEASGDLHILFTPEAVFVCGQLLRASRTGYDLAMELGQRLLELGVNMISVTPEVTVDDLREAMARFSAFDAAGGTGERPNVGGFAMRRVDASIRLDDEESLAGQLVATYSYAVVGMRRLFEEIKEGRYVFTRFVKRVLQRLIQLSDRAPEIFTGLVNYRTAHNDESGRAVNAAVITIAMGRNLTRDYAFLSRLGMAAMLFDAGLPRAAGMGFPDPDRLTAAIPRLTRDQRRTVPASNALVQIALSRMHGEAEARTVIGYESNWLAARKILPPLYGGAFEPALEATLVATVYRFIQLTTFDVWVEKTATLDDAIYTLRSEARTDVERALVELLVGTLGVFPRGTPVELTSGWRGVVERLAKPSQGFRRSQVLLVVDPTGAPCAKRSVDLLTDESVGVIERRLSEPGDHLLAVAREIVALARLARATGETALGAGAVAAATPTRTPQPSAASPAPRAEGRAPSGGIEVALVDGAIPPPRTSPPRH